MSSASTFTLLSHFNFAKRSSIISVPAASVFAVIYLPLLCWFLFLGLRNPTYVYATLSSFCLIRIPSFVIRAILAGNLHSAAEKLGLVVADQVLFGVGFFGLLYSAYILVLDREIATGHAPPPKHISYKFRRNRTLFRFLLSAAVLLSICGACMTTPTRSVSTDHTLLALRQASTSIFFVLTVLQGALMVRLGWVEIKDRANGISHAHVTTTKFGSRHTLPLLTAVTLLLLLRQTFAMTTVNDSVTQNKEHYWYPFITVPELLAVLIYALPGLVPSKTQEKACEKKQDTESQSSSRQTSSQVSISSRDADPERSRPSRSGSEETEVDNVTLMSEKHRGSKWDLKSNVHSVVMVTSETENMLEEDATSKKRKEQITGNAKPDKEGLRNEVNQNAIVPISKIIIGKDSDSL